MTQRIAVFPADRHSLYEEHGYSAAIRSGDLLFVSGQIPILAWTIGFDRPFLLLIPALKHRYPLHRQTFALAEQRHQVHPEASL